MAQIPKKSVRRLVTLPPDLAERVEKFRETSGATSESDALKVLIEDGLKRRDTPEDIFQRCETATASGQSIGDIINLVTSDHPLIEQTVLDAEALMIFLRVDSSSPPERFRYSRFQRKWYWERKEGNYSDSWSNVRRISQSSYGGGYGSGGDFMPSGPDLDDEIPF